MCEGFVSTVKQTGVYLNTSGVNYEMVVKTDGHINSIEVAVLCLLQKTRNDDAQSSDIQRDSGLFTLRSFTPSTPVPTAPPHPKKRKFIKY